MTPRRRKPKGSSPKSKVKKVLARWSDGLFYVIKILKVSEIKKRCLVEFEDQSTAYVHFKDLLDEHKEEVKTCHNCGGEDELENNAFIRCSNCDRDYHRHCHVPPIISDPMAKQFVCRICVFASCAKAGGAKDTGPMAARFMFMKREFPYDLEHLSWNPSHTSNTSECYCYCGGPGSFFNKMLQCCRCHQWFHEACVQCISGGVLMGDRFYIFACAHCNYGEEFLKRLELSWQNVVYISIFHLSMTQSLKYTDLDTDIIPFIKQQAYSFGLHKLFNTQHIDTELLRQTVLKVVTSQDDIYCCGSKVKKKHSLYGLRERIPPPPPSFFIPYQAEKISDLTLTNSLGKRTLFKPPKYVNPLPYLIRGANKFIPSTMSLKLREASMARLKSEHNYCSTSDEYSSSSDRDSIISKENYDANNNSSPAKQSSLLSNKIKRETSEEKQSRLVIKKELSDEQSESSSDGSEEYADPVQRICPLSFSQDEDPCRKVISKEVSLESEKSTKFWSLDTAFPEPTDFTGINNPFLTDIELEDLKEQRKHFLKQLEHLSQTMGDYASAESKTRKSSPVTIPSPHLKNIKGFKGELAKIFKTNGYSSSGSLRSKDNHHYSPTNSISPEKFFSNAYNSPKTRRSDNTISSHGSMDSMERNHKDTDLPGVKGIKLSPHLESRLSKKNASFKKPQRSNNSHETRAEEKRMKAISRCLKNLTPTCGFHFPVLDENHPSLVIGIGSDEEDKKSNSDLGRRGLKRKHSNHTRDRPSKRSRKDDHDDIDDCIENGHNQSSVESVRRSHRSRQAVKRFETADMNLGKSDSINSDVQLNSNILSMAKYNVVSLRVRRQDNTVDYLVDWFE